MASCKPPRLPRSLPLGQTCVVNRAHKFRLYQAVALTLTFVIYVFLHAARKTFANVKPSIKDDWTDTMFGGDGNACEDFFGTLDAVFMFAYAVGLLLLGQLGDRFDMRWVLFVGMCGPAIPIGAFAAGSALGVRSPAYYVALWLLNGLAQSLVWPSVVAVMGNWYGFGTRGFIMGLWSGNASAGNIVGALLVTPVLAAWGWQACFYVIICLLVGSGVACLLVLAPHPRDVGLPAVGNVPSGQLAEAIELYDAERELALAAAADERDLHAEFDDDAKSAQTGSLLRRSGVSPSHSSTAGGGAISFFQAVLLPGVIIYSLSYAAIKSINYTLFYWLPYYLTEDLNWNNGDADSYSSLNDVGGIVGACVIMTVCIVSVNSTRLQSVIAVGAGIVEVCVKFVSYAPRSNP